MTGRHVTRTWGAVSMTVAVLAACSGGRSPNIGIQPEGTRSVLTSPISFEHRLEAETPEAPTRRIRLGNRASVTIGDRIQAVVRPTSDAYLYIGYCDGRELALFPPEGGIVQAKANHETLIPSDRPFEIVGGSKSEVFYLIVSKHALSLASPDLAIEIAKSGAPVDGDCAGPMGDDAGVPIPPSTPVEARPSDGAIKVVRYELKLRASARSSPSP